jgi:hypothetical protein
MIAKEKQAVEEALSRESRMSQRQKLLKRLWEIERLTQTKANAPTKPEQRIETIAG